MVNKRKGLCMGAVLNLAHENDMIAFVIPAAVKAFEPGGATHVQPGCAIGCLRERHAIESFGMTAAREFVGQQHLICAQHLYYIPIAVFEGRKRR